MFSLKGVLDETDLEEIQTVINGQYNESEEQKNDKDV